MKLNLELFSSKIKPIPVLVPNYEIFQSPLDVFLDAHYYYTTQMSRVARWLKLSL